MDIKQYVTAGKATFTITIPPADAAKADCNTHYTYRVNFKEGKNGLNDAYFVKVLTGPENTKDYTYVGMLDAETGVTVTTRASKFNDKTPLFRVLNFVLGSVWQNKQLPAGYEVKHLGHCGKCGRDLTTPESLARGIGPECWVRMGRPLRNETTRYEPSDKGVDQDEADRARAFRTPEEQAHGYTPLIDRLHSAQEVARQETREQLAKRLVSEVVVEENLWAEGTHPVAPFAAFSAHESEFSAEASTLGFKTGEWPDMFVVTSDAKAVLLHRAEAFYHKDDLGGFRYHSNNGFVFTVFND